MSLRSLSGRLKRNFSSQSVFSGENYYYTGAVTEVSMVAGGASGQVRGQKRYRVNLKWSEDAPGSIQAACSCPHFDNGNFCKHLWAFLLKLDDSVEYPQWLLRGQLTLEFGSSEVAQIRLPEPKNPSLPASNWRDVFKDQNRMAQGQTQGWRRVAERQVFIVLAPGDDEGTVKLKFYLSEYVLGRALPIARALALPQNGEIHGRDPQFQDTIKAIVTLSFGEMAAGGGYYRYRHQRDPSVRVIKASSLRVLAQRLFESGRVFAHEDDFARSTPEKSLALQYTRFGRFRLKVTDTEQGFVIDGSVESLSSNLAVQAIPVSELKMWAAPYFFGHQNQVGFLDLNEAERSWLEELTRGAVPVPREDEEAFLDAIMNQQIQFDLPESLNWKEVREVPTAQLELVSDRLSKSDRYLVELKFSYGSRRVSYWNPQMALPSSEEKRIYLRDRTEEERVYQRLPLHLVSQWNEGEPPFIHSRNLMEFAKTCLDAGIAVEVESKRVAPSSDFRFSVSSGVDWFDVDGQAQFAGRWVKYPAILEAIQRGERFVPLEDGILGLVGEDIVARLQRLSDFAEPTRQGLRFGHAQGFLLNSLLAEESSLSFDAKFGGLRKKIKSFEGIRPVAPCSIFKGRLRQYQREGLGWLHFLNSFNLGGILADDMGLGKTVQCLAFLAELKQRGDLRPALLVAPKSLLENWRLEAQRFTPDLRVLVHSGAQRETVSVATHEYDLIVTTYQTMLRDIATFKEVEWKCVIADEAQAIKNPQAQVTKAVKVLRASFRLAMTGTPIENSLEDLFSISDFVNPGFLNAKGRRTRLQVGQGAREALAAAFKPVILRRTKEQVLRDLPAKTEQLIVVELEAKQQKIYNELKRYYQSQLLREVRENGVKKSQIQILAALTRLRQAALHPGLIDVSQKKAKSAKFQAVLEMLEEIIGEGHRVLIFSQFTSLLALFKDELVSRKIEFSYLDGQTRRRQEVVDSFKTSSVPVFLMSLKAGGVGLNLVEADYVFLLDPWWNPATESQAIDRVHRIGQKRAVNAYRIIAKNTVEEKIRELQATKRNLATEFIDQKSSLIRQLSAQDIENLFA